MAMQRIPEEELMNRPLNAKAYAKADFSEPNSSFVAFFAEKFPAFSGRKILDLGCGPADITIRFAKRYPQASVLGLDGAGAMLALAKKAILQESAMANRVKVGKWHIGREACPLGTELFDAVISNSLLHHMREPLDLWRAIRACAAAGAAVLVMDLLRPLTRADAANIVAAYAGKESEALKKDFLNSLLAAYRLAEIEDQLVSAKLDFLHVEVVTDRHFIVSGSIA
ncbi:MAG: class I SAM-dependent methyltransferase [Methylocapsa sp.]|nr:class I SAM-dependent methyltransferase [Methylocapsa sp.]